MNMALTPELVAKEARLKDLLRSYGTLAVAYSGGVDSTYLADVAFETLGDAARMVVADSPSIPRSELAEARRIAQERGWRLEVIKTVEFENEEYLKNDGRRCYICKTEMFMRMEQLAREAGVHVLAYGENADDGADPTRLGARAAQEHEIVAPLAQLGFHKEDIRALSRARGLPTWDKASFACLSSRFPKGTRIEIEALLKVERAEEVLRGLGFHQYRARHHGDLCRVEVEREEFGRLLDEETRRAVVDGLTAAGYRFVTLDLAGYRTGSTA